MTQVRVRVGGRALDAPEGSTVLAAVESAGGSVHRLDSCRQGSCGACLTVCATPGSHGPKLVLACQTEVRAGMWIGAEGGDRKGPAAYALDALRPDRESLLRVYPELDRCEPCGACSSACPQQLNVHGYMQAMREGDLAAAASLSMECTMCTACSVACPSALHPYRYAVLARRLHARHGAPAPADVAERASAVDAGAHQEELSRLSSLSEEELAARYVAARAERGFSGA